MSASVWIEYDSNRHGWGVLDAEIERVAKPGKYEGGGTSFDDGYRDRSFGYKTLAAANCAIKRIRKHFRGYHLRTRLVA